MSHGDPLERIRAALEAAVDVIRATASGRVCVDRKANGDFITDVDSAVDETLRALLPRDGEGWLSEETPDHSSRVERRRVWVVDPLDGTREFVSGIPEWCVSIGLVENGSAVAGGVYNPATDELFLGSRETGVILNGRRVRVRDRTSLEGAVVLASRTELTRGEWRRFRDAPFTVRPMGSVAQARPGGCGPG